MREEHYQNRVTSYGMGHTRRDRILALAAGKNMRVLDVGCANGALGARIREQGNWVAGIEMSHEAVIQAQERLNAVWSFDIERSWPDDIKLQPFDLVILGEVLEHVFDPVQVLKHVRGVLKDGGHVVITTPNFMTWTNRIRFMFGDFKYKIEGMFDFGHIRWFTYRYLKEVMIQSGFIITDERHIIFPGKLTAVLKHWPSVFAFQFIIKAYKK